jgi:hypothetical protein
LLSYIFNGERSRENTGIFKGRKYFHHNINYRIGRLI